MKKSSLVLVIILVVASIIFTEHKTHAWYSYGKPGDWPIHTALALLSLEKVMQSDEFKGLNWGQIYNVLIDGANAPDRHKKWLDHEATFRIEDTLCASVKAKKNLDALKRLAIGFHYLGDNGDATEGSYKSELAGIAYKMLFEDDDTNRDPKYKIRWGFRKDSKWGELKLQYDQIISQIDNVDSLVKALRDMAKDRGKKLRDAYRDRYFIKVREEFMHTFAFIRACQNRLIDFYNEELRDGDSGECPSKETEVEDRNEDPDNPRNTCNVKDLSEGESNLCHYYTKWLRGPLDNYLVGAYVVNEKTVIDGWRPPAGYVHSRFQLCTIVLPLAEKACRAANRRGIPSDIQLD